MTETSVLHLITRFRSGGSETTTVNELRTLLDADVDYELHLGYGLDSNESAVADVALYGIKTTCFEHIQHYSLVHTVPAVLQVTRYLLQHNIDVIHTHSTEAGIIGRWAGVLAKTSTIIHEVHGDPITEDRSALLNRFILMMERLTAPFATKIIVKSERIREDFLERKIGARDQYELIYHGVDTEQYADVPPATLPDSDAGFRLLFVGRLVDGKGLYDLLEAFETVREDTDVELLIIGDGPLADDLTRYIDRNELSEDVQMLGYRSDIPNLLAASDFLVLPSYREGTPRVISEALASGTPVVSTRIAGIPEQVTDGKTGLLYDPGDVQALEDAISNLLDDHELRQEMATRCETSVDKFSRERANHQIRELYDSLTQ